MVSYGLTPDTYSITSTSHHKYDYTQNATTDMRTQKLELTWIGKEASVRLEPRILIEDAALSYHARHRFGDNDIFENRLIFGDNLLGLKAIEQEFAGLIRCIYIDPPYNTGSAFEHYDDGIEHSLWLSLMRDRIEILFRLLRPDGSIWISIDDNEFAYLKVLLDEIFGRSNFVTTIIWEKRTTRENRRVFSFKHDYVLVYAKDRKRFEETRHNLPPNDDVYARYKNPDNDPRGPWQSVSANAMAGHATPNQFYTLIAPSGVRHDPPTGRCWLYTLPRMKEEIAAGNIWFGKDGKGVPRIKKFWSEYGSQGLTPETIWYAADVGTNDSATKGLVSLMVGTENFTSPKPEGLVHRVLQIATDPGDWVLDSFAGSGTTGAVAHKMGRRWIMVELGEHCHTHIIPRLKKVIDGQDPGGVTEATDWNGGGGFRYYRLAPSLLEKDSFGNWIISRQFNAAMLAEAVCKLEGFQYAPSEAHYWQHGHSTESDFIYVTTQTLTREQIARLSEEVGDKRSLLVMCSAFRSRNLEAFPNLTVKKIPKTVLTRCEWGRDDYSLEIKNLPAAAPEPATDIAPASNNRAARKSRAIQATRSLFE